VLSPEKGDDSSNYKASELVPFAARIVIERMTCGTSRNQQFVRVLVNDAIQPLKWCEAENGLCRVEMVQIRRRVK
jgi:hypothetical protein